MQPFCFRKPKFKPDHHGNSPQEQSVVRAFKMDFCLPMKHASSPQKWRFTEVGYAKFSNCENFIYPSRKKPTHSLRNAGWKTIFFLKWSRFRWQVNLRKVGKWVWMSTLKPLTFCKWKFQPTKNLWENRAKKLKFFFVRLSKLHWFILLKSIKRLQIWTKTNAQGSKGSFSGIYN